MGSNHRPSAYEALALPTELRGRLYNFFLLERSPEPHGIAQQFYVVLCHDEVGAKGYAGIFIISSC